jgi:RNA polymerase sigma-70 factor (ECF subfamily)
MRAQEAIYRAYAGAVYTLARRLVLRPAVAAELLPDTFVEVLRNLRAYRGHGAFGAWIRSIAVSQCLPYLRSPWHCSLLWSNAYAEDLEPQLDPPDEAPCPGTVVGAQMDLEHALRRLTPLACTIVWLDDVAGYTHEGIASQLGRTRSFSKSQLARA